MSDLFDNLIHFIASHKLIILICCILMAIPFFWFKPGYIDIGGDSSRLYFYDPLNFLKSFVLNIFLPDSLGIKSGQTSICTGCHGRGGHVRLHCSCAKKGACIFAVIALGVALSLAARTEKNKKNLESSRCVSVPRSPRLQKIVTHQMQNNGQSEKAVKELIKVYTLSTK
jgi:hypothetical protein